MKKLRITLFSILCFLGCASAHSATELEKIMANMGGIDLKGLPKLSLEMVDRYDLGELAALEFEFTLTHKTVLRHGRTAKTEWSINNLQTCVYIDARGDVIWRTTRGQTVRFHKKGTAYAKSINGTAVNVVPESNTVEITTPASVTWRYRNGFLESIDYRKNNYSVTTDRGTILSISKKILNREMPLLKCVYSARNGLEELEFYGGRKYRLSWSAGHDLLAIDAPKGRQLHFEYVDSLLTCWTRENGPCNELKWQRLDYIRETAFQIPPVLLREDASHLYEYKLDKWGGVINVKTHDKSGALVSETDIKTTSIEQATPNEKIKYIFKKKSITHSLDT